MQENQKISKIINELSLYFFDNISFNLNIEVKEYDEEVVITFITELLDEETQKFLYDQLSEERNYEIENYGWELVGEGDSGDDLELIGTLVDEMNITEENGKSVITLVRYM
ncbi:MAG: hypothetical protein ACI35S_02645 [Anaeroplasma sp.]